MRLSLANERMEFFRSLPYDDVGVVSGFPAGTVPQTSTSTFNGIEFAERVRIDYIDDPADDIAGVDSNGIVTDYKQIRLEYAWNLSGIERTIALASYVVPRSIETNVGGGTIRINVLDADNLPLADASVRLFSSSSTFAYDVTNPTSVAGAALFAVPADSGYQVEVSANIGGQQYSTSSTHVASTYNPNPAVSPFAVVEAGISTLTFQIGELSDLDVSTVSSIVEGSQLEVFSSLAGVSSTTDTTTVVSGDLVLTDTLGVYLSNGIAYLTPVVPAAIENWEVIRIAADVPINTEYVLQLFTGDSLTSYSAIPDADLPGNAVGFSDSLIDISSLDTLLYPTTTIGISLRTTDTSVTPEITEVEVFWRDNAVTLSNQSLDIRGEKIIGTDVGTLPIYKSTSTVSTNVSGEILLPDVEFDTYSITPNGSYDLATACPEHPFLHQAGVDAELTLQYVSNVSDSVRAIVQDSFGRAIPGVSVRLQRSGYDVTQLTNTCGQTFFSGGLADAADYELTATVAGYPVQTIDPFTVSGDVVTEITLTP